MRKKTISCVIAGAMAVLLTVSGSAMPIKAQASKTRSVTASYSDISRASVHDPSIVKDHANGQYYVFGSHLATAKSEDLVNWKQISSDYENAGANPVYGNVYENFAKSFRWAGYDDGDCSGGQLAVWAPDVTWDEQYEWEDGSKGAYLMYYSASSTWKRSCIGLAVSKTIMGPYRYKNTLLYSGMTTTGATDGKSKRNTKWDNDYLNFKSLIAKGSKNGGINDISPNWFKKDGSYNTNYAPNAIDPTIINGADGKRYLVYGSWSGGLFMLEVDSRTGSVIYPGEDKNDESSGNYVDRYYGTHIAGGNHQSGEGAYIVYDKETSYYYLYETYGGLTRTGGYNMRLFRSKGIYGPYMDATGRNAKDSGKDNYKYGIKLMGNYQFYNQRGYCSAGHNSALLDEDGNRYLVFHQRFNEGTEYHEVRVHQQFINEEGWPVTAVYENRNEQITTYADQEVLGTYEFVNHGTAAADGSMITTKFITLNANGTVTGEESGTWSKKRAPEGYDYITVNIGDAKYQGVFYKQTKDTGEQAMTFTAIGTNNECIWGSKLTVSDKTMVAMVADKLSIPSTAREDLTLPTSLNGASISYHSDHPFVLSNKGIVHSRLQDTTVMLTATIKYQTASIKKDYKINVFAIPSLITGYDFKKGNGVNIPSIGISSRKGDAVLQGTASIVKDEERGEVLLISNQKGAKKANYLQLPSQTFETVTNAGYSISMWVNIATDTFEHSALFEADKDSAYPMTRIGANLIGRINANGYSDAIANNIGKRETWQMITYTVTTSGIKVYLNDQLVAEDKKDITSCFDSTNEASIEKATDVKVGSGDVFGDEDIRSAKFDNVLVFQGQLTQKEVRALYRLTSR